MWLKLLLKKAKGNKPFRTTSKFVVYAVEICANLENKFIGKNAAHFYKLIQSHYKSLYTFRCVWVIWLGFCEMALEMLHDIRYQWLFSATNSARAIHVSVYSVHVQNRWWIEDNGIKWNDSICHFQNSSFTLHLVELNMFQIQHCVCAIWINTRSLADSFNVDKCRKRIRAWMYKI